MPMYYIVYLSSASTLYTEFELHDILEVSRQNNEKIGVTGMLLYFDGSIIQIIEGDEHAVNKLYNKILQDPRHKGFLKILEGQTDQRNFPDWSMGFKSLKKEDLKNYPGYKDFKNDNLTQVQLASNHPALEMLKSFYKDYKEKS